MKECEVKGLAGEFCKRLSACYFEVALALQSEPNDSKDLMAFRSTVERNKESCKRSSEVLSVISERVQGDTPGVDS